jgi:phosphoribosylglycinamide formyltransferase-1
LGIKWFDLKAFDIDGYAGWDGQNQAWLPAAQPCGRYRGRMPARLVVLVSGAGTNLQALLDASASQAYGAEVVAVGADRDGIEALARAERAGVPSFIHRVEDFSSRKYWDRALTVSCAMFEPDLVVSAGFMKIVGQAFLGRFGGRFINTHPALLPAFPGMHGVRDALEYGVKVTGCTVFLVDAGTDTGPVMAQAAVPVHDDDDVAALHERVKVAERSLLVDTVGQMAHAGWSVEGRKVRLGR